MLIYVTLRKKHKKSQIFSFNYQCLHKVKKFLRAFYKKGRNFTSIFINCNNFQNILIKVIFYFLNYILFEDSSILLFDLII